MVHSKPRKLREGKTKIIWETDDPNKVIIQSKDDITAGDGVRRELLERKAVHATVTTSNCFNLLNRRGVRTHYIRRLSLTKFEARRVGMIPLEVVIRRIATGSYLKRNPGVREGEIFEKPIVEFFLKDDARHDPLIGFDWRGGEMCLYDAKSPSDDLVGIESFDDWKIGGRRGVHSRRIDEHLIIDLEAIVRHVFAVLEKAWAVENVTLVDLKIECGFDWKTGEIIVADVIDNDSWRIWPGGEKSAQLDKQVFRDLETITPEAMVGIKDNYALVAELTGRFLEREPRWPPRMALPSMGLAS